MQIGEIVKHLESIAPSTLQEAYDNAGLITGNMAWECSGIIVSLDATEAVIMEAVEKKCNLVVAHHPIVFNGLKKITGKNYVEKTIIAAIKYDIAIFAIHTNLDNILQGVNGKIADKLGLVNRQVLAPKQGFLKKLVVFTPVEHAEKVRSAIFSAGAGQIGEYSECSFNTKGEGTFKAGRHTNAFVGEKGKQHTENEIRTETVFPSWLEKDILSAITKTHPYEEVAYDIYTLDNRTGTTGAGITGELPEAIEEIAFLKFIKEKFNTGCIRHTGLTGKTVKKVAVCGGAGSFLIKTAMAAGADFYITGDVKYHEFFGAEGRIVLADIGHFESEQFTIDLLFDILKEKFTTFATLKTGVYTNPVQYF
ncbi:MAG: Nif3-like dinuclear metal center hexameric protein [Ferruginibacter sp.]